MSGFDRRQFLKLTGGSSVVALSGLAGCSGGPSGGAETTDNSDGGSGDDETTTQSTDEVDANIGMVYATGGLGDGSFNDQAQSGLKDANEEWDLAYEEAQPENVSDFANYQEQFAQSTDPEYDLISTIGFLQADALSETAADYPDQKFMIVDSVVEEPNVNSYVFAEHEGSYLAGQLVAMLTSTEFSAGAAETVSDEKTVGFVGGVQSDLIEKFEAGFRAGVADIDDEISIQSSYVGDFNDPSGGKEAALTMYGDGADFVYHAAGNTGTGVFQAAQEEGRFAIGVDRDQSLTKDSYADVILASMVKRVDTAVYNAIDGVVEGTFEGGNVTPLGLQDEGVALVYGDEIGSDVPSDVVDTVDSARQAIIDGDISVPTSPDDV
ncbi:putative ABC-type transport system, periplasmic component/surface lipoprotein [Halanaeroarchaeum sp. HSR-CO]|uniref:BMP family lipoprotein n=1 Tax=Halanaeroarchaeum sp. HSR-CO TaxID=2866382 RepID=UPI00217D668A|nr:BMP family protein [Halanaeroarchaeum sp. HSR-CO]UWG48206.1 putative ABC-type transport system, periplasmic component/surface lipoprotein [Halanaeroarchaeum sp. HSR-CO]